MINADGYNQRKKYRTIIATVVLFIIAGAMLSHIFMSIMPDCPSMSSTSFCGTVEEQMTLWTRWFTGMPQAFVLFLLACVAYVWVAFERHANNSAITARGRPYLVAHEPIIHLFYLFRPLFADGILHPKRHA